MSESNEGRTDAPKTRKPRKKSVTLLRGYVDGAGTAHAIGETVPVAEKEARRLVEELGAANYGPMD